MTHFLIYRTLRPWGGKWRVRIMASNGRQLFKSSEAYRNWQDAEHACKLVAPGAEVRVVR